MTNKIQIVRFSIIQLYGVSKAKQEYTVKFNCTKLIETMFIVILVDNIYSFSFFFSKKISSDGILNVYTIQHHSVYLIKITLNYHRCLPL